MGRSMLRPYKKLLPVRKHLLHAGDVRRIHQCELFQFTHAPGGFRAHEMTLARMHADDFSVGSHLETLFSATMSLQFQFWLRRVSGHGLKFSSFESRRFAAYEEFLDSYFVLERGATCC